MDAPALEAALQGFAEGLRADGYDLSVAAGLAGALEVRIVAGPDQCPDCLVPKELFLGMITTAVDDATASRIELVYPES